MKIVNCHHSSPPPNNFFYLLPCAADGEHHTTSLYLTEVPRLTTVARSGHASSSGELRRHQWTPGP
jgi:hypothetical protein